MLDAGVLVGDLKAGLHCPYAHIELGHLGDHQDLDVIVLRQGGEVVGIRRFHPTLELAPKIELPTQVEGGAIAAS
ncbi:hypothetical protein D3C75_1083880 [compost metagenome]